jgi:hypothetical protein
MAQEALRSLTKAEQGKAAQLHIARGKYQGKAEHTKQQHPSVVIAGLA